MPEANFKLMVRQIIHSYYAAHKRSEQLCAWQDLALIVHPDWVQRRGTSTAARRSFGFAQDDRV